MSGKVYETGTDSLVAGVTISNKVKKTMARTLQDGSYTILAAEGDTIVFTHLDYVADTVIVASHMLLIPEDVTLKRKVVTLENVTVINSYQRDSLERRDAYQNIYNDKRNITGYNRPEKGFGITLSPVSHFSKEQKAQRGLKKRLQREEQESYIDFMFSEKYVANLTKLQGDSLSLFMYRYRPSYKFCRDADRTKMLEYVNDKLKEFRKGTIGIKNK